MPALLAFLGSAVAKFFGNSIIKFIALKALLLSLTTIVLPVVLFKVWLNCRVWLMDFISGQISSLTAGAISEPAVIQFTGLAAWMADLLKLPQCLSVMLSCAVVAFGLSFIRK